MRLTVYLTSLLTTASISLGFSQPFKLDTISQTYQSTGSHYSLQLEYPQLSGEGYEEINRLIREHFTVPDSAIRENIKAWHAENFGEDCGLEQLIHFDIHYISADYISFIKHDDQCGVCTGTGPCSFHSFYNYRPKDAYPYALADLLAGNYHKVIISRSEYFAERNRLDPPLGPKAFIDQCSFYYKVDIQGLFIRIPYLRWVEEVHLPLKEYRSLLNPNGPLRSLLKE